MLPAMCAYLEALGFRCYDMAEPRLTEDGTALWQMDFFFCRIDSPLFSVGDA